MWSHEDTNNILINKNAVLFIFEIIKKSEILFHMDYLYYQRLYPSLLHNAFQNISLPIC